ncbi:hypothetical protein [Streptomyces griseofuscus]|uniref:hypothetical protein n=1 Tax=Streptomyces griseofuscus TaxID=146922 RepID=UPI003805411F
MTYSGGRSWNHADPDLVMVIPDGGWPGERRWIAELVVSPEETEPGGALYWRDGRIAAKHPSDVLLAKMCQMARVLNTRVQGDDGEDYDA